MKKYIFALIIGFSFIFSPIFYTNTLYAYNIGDPIVPGCNTGSLVDKPILDKNGSPMKNKEGQIMNERNFATPCGFDYIMLLINNIISFLLFFFATPLAAIALCYAGALMLFSGGSPEKLTKAKTIIKNVVIGYILALAAWLIVNTIFTTLGFTGKTYLK